MTIKANQVLFVLLCLCSSSLHSQNKIIDSLQNVLNHSKEDTNKVKLLQDISLKFLDVGEFEQVFKYGSASLVLAEKLGIKSKVAQAYHFLGYINNEKSNYSEALKNYNIALKMKVEIGDKAAIANTLNNIAIVYRAQGKHADALKNYSTSLKIREEIDDKPGIASSLHNIGNIYRDQGNYPEALKNFFASLKIKQMLGNKSDMISSYYVIAFAYDYMGNYPESLKNLLAALALCKEIGNKNEIAVAYGNIGNMYNNQGNYAEALKNYLIAMGMFLENGNKRRLGITYNNIGTVYGAQGRVETDSAKKKEYFNEALKYYMLDLKLSQEIGDKVGIGFDYNNIGVTFINLKKYDEALENLFTGLKIRKEIGEKRSIINSYMNLGNVYYEMKIYSEARQFLNEGLSISVGAGLKDRTREIYRGLQKVDSAGGSWPEAYNNYKLFVTYRDSLVNEENAKKAVRLQMQYDFDKKEDSLKYEQSLIDEQLKQQTLLTQKKEQSLLLKERELLLSNQEKELQHLAHLKTQADLQIEQSHNQEKEKQLTMVEQEKLLQFGQLKLQQTELDLKENQLQAQKRQRLFYIGGVVLLILLFVFVYRNIKIRQRTDKIIAAERLKSEKVSSAHKMAELELQSLRAQLNPHFMFNSLNAIQELILKEDNDNSHLYLSRFSDLLRMLLDNANHPFVPLRKEINLLELYLSLENLRIPDLKYCIEIDPSIDSN
ncbi:MAG TPA: tetratricopeptide repeat protein, partial [Chitinophagaceae bacterium]